MEVGHWITIGIFGIGQLTALILTYVNLRVKIKELEMNIETIKETAKNNLHSFHIHEQQNEKMFDKFEKKMEEVHKGVDEIKNILINKHYN